MCHLYPYKNVKFLWKFCQTSMEVYYINFLYSHPLIFTKLGETTIAEKAVNPHFGSDLADRINPEKQI